MGLSVAPFLLLLWPLKGVEHWHGVGLGGLGFSMYNEVGDLRCRRVLGCLIDGLVTNISDKGVKLQLGDFVQQRID